MAEQTKGHSLSRQGLFAFSFSCFAIFSTFLAFGAIIFEDAFSAFIVTFLATASTSIYMFAPNSRFKSSIREYYQQHQSLIEETEALNAQNSSPGSKPESQVKARTIFRR